MKDAIFMLNASRIGHGLPIQQDEELKRLIAERRICVELCPKSNQFTNGFISMFAPEQAKKSIISLADQEVLSILAAEYLDIGKD